jgi:hypothetical protein
VTRGVWAPQNSPLASTHNPPPPHGRSQEWESFATFAAAVVATDDTVTGEEEARYGQQGDRDLAAAAETLVYK